MTSLSRATLPLLILLSMACGLLHGTDILVPDNPSVTGTVVIGDGTTGTVTANAYVIKPGANVIFQGTSVDLKAGFWAQAGCSFDARIYVPPPFIASLTPVSGSINGFASVQIGGNNLANPTSVTFGGVAATVDINSATLLLVGTPPHAAGVVDVTVTTANGSSTKTAAYTYVVTPPTITTISPSSAPGAGGTVVTISGTDLTGTSAVTFGGVPGTISIIQQTSVTVVTPPGTGVVDVRVTTPSGSATKVGGFTYVAGPPTITTIAPSSGPSTGNTTVTINGTNLLNPAVTFAGSAASVVSSTLSQIVVTNPANAAGNADVVVTTSSGSVTKTGGFTYVAAPTITSLTPTTGPSTGGTSVTITGTNLANPSVVTFGGANAAIVSSTSTQVVVTAPSNSPGTVDVVVTTAGGSVTKTGGFVYPIPVPVISAIAPSTGMTTVGTSVTITGTGLANPTGVTFGGAPGTIVSSSATQEVVIAPAHPTAGAVDVVVTTGGGSATRTAGFTYTLPPPLPTVAFQAATSTVSESVGSANLGVVLLYPSASPVTVAYAVTGGTAQGSGPGADYALSSGTLTFAANVTAMNIPLTIINDTIAEDDETVVVTLSAPTQATLGANVTHTCTITDDDPGAPRFSPAGGTFIVAPLTVVIAPRPSTAQVWYTLDGTTPVAAAPSLQYTASLAISATTTIKAISVTGSGGSQRVSAVATATFVRVDPTAVAYPHAPPSGGSPTSPFCVEFTTPTTGVGITMDGNGVAATDLHVIGPNLVFGNVPLVATGQATTITTRVHADANTSGSTGDAVKTEAVTWVVTDLFGKDASTPAGKIAIRHGDSLLIAASNAAGPWTLDPGTGTGPQPISFGAKVPTAFPQAGTYLVVASDLTGTLGSLQVTVVDAPFPASEVIAAEVGYARPYAVTLIPGGDDQDVVFSAADPNLLDVQEDAAHTTYASQAMTLKPKSRGFPVVLSRLGAGGPIISWKEVTEFTIERPSVLGLVAGARNNTYGYYDNTTGYLAMHPYIPGVTFAFTGALANSMTTTSITSDSMKRSYDPAMAEVVAGWVFHPNLDPSTTTGTVSWQVTASQATPAPVQVSASVAETSPLYAASITIVQPSGGPGSNFLKSANGAPNAEFEYNTYLLEGGTLTTNAASTGASPVGGYSRGPDYQVATQLSISVSPAPPANSTLWSRLSYVDVFRDETSPHEDYIATFDIATIEQTPVSRFSAAAPVTIARTLYYYGGATNAPVTLNPGRAEGELMHVLTLSLDADGDGTQDSRCFYVEPMLDADIGGPHQALPAQTSGAFGLSVNHYVMSNTYTYSFATHTLTTVSRNDAPNGITVALDGTNNTNLDIAVIVDPYIAGDASLETVSILPSIASGMDLGNALAVTVQVDFTSPVTHVRIGQPGYYTINWGSFSMGLTVTGSAVLGKELPTGQIYTPGTVLPTWDSPIDLGGTGGTVRFNDIDWETATSTTYPSGVDMPQLQGVPALSASVTRDSTLFGLVDYASTPLFAAGQLSATMPVSSLGNDSSRPYYVSGQYSLDGQRDCDTTFGFLLGGTLRYSTHVARLSDRLGPVTSYDRAVSAFPGYATVNPLNGNLHLAIPVQSYRTGNPGPDIVLHYNSRDAIDCGYGPGWRTNYDMRVYRAGRTCALVDLDSQRILFDANGHADADPGRHLAMELAWKDLQTHTLSSSADWQSGEMYRLVRHDNRVYYFDANGFLLRIHQLDGRELHLLRDGKGVAQSVQDDFGRSEDLKPATLGVTSGHLAALSHEISGIWGFAYDSNAFLTDMTLSSLVNGTQSETLHIHVAYDAQARVTSLANQTQSGVDTTIGYSPWTVTDALGGVSYLYGGGAVKDPVGILHVVTATSSFMALATDGSGGFNAGTKQGQTDLAYDAIGNLVSQTVYDRTGHQQVTTWKYTDLTDQDATILGANLLVGQRALSVSGIEGQGVCDLVTSYRYQTACGKTRGQVLSATDPTGNTTTSTYDPSTGYLMGTVDARGKAWSYSNFNAVGQPQLVTAPGTPVRSTSRTYNPDGTLASETDVQAGFVTSYGYDSMGRQSRVTPPGISSDVLTTYDALGRVLSTRDVNGYIVTRTYDSLGRQLSESRPGAADVKTAYTKSNGEWLATQTRGTGTASVSIVHTDFIGRTTSVEVFRTLVLVGGVVAGSNTSCKTTSTYDPTYGWLTKTTAPLGVDGPGYDTVYVPDLIGRTTKVTTPENDVTTTVYNGLGWVLSTTDPVGAVTTTTYTPAGQVCKTINALGGVVETRYDATGNPAAVVPSLGNATSIQYDDTGMVIGQTDALKVITTRVIDPVAKTITTTVTPTNPDVGDTPTVTTTTLDTRGFPKSQANTLGTTNMTMYDDGTLNKVTPPGRGEIVRSRSPVLFQPTDDAIPATLAGNVHQPLHQQTGYDTTFGAPNLVTEPFKRQVAPQRDAVTGEVNKVVDNVSNATAAANDPLQEVKSRDKNGNVLHLVIGNVVDVVQTFDHDDRITSRTAKGAMTSWTYTHRGQIATMTAGGVTTTYQYDLLGQAISTVAPGRSPRTADYDSFGVLQQSSDGLAFTNQVYDANTRQLLSTVESSGKVTSYQYDARGRTKDVADNRGGGVHTDYDPFDRATTLTYRDSKTEAFTYEPTGEVKTRKDRGNRTVTYTHDESGHLLQSSTSTGTTVAYALSLPANGGKVESRTLGSQVISRTSDARGRLATLSMTGATDVTFSYYGDDSPNSRAGIIYGYDPVVKGRLTSITETGVGAAQFGYDANGKLKTATLPNGVVRTYTYDSSGALGELQQKPGDAAAEDWLLTRDGQGRIAQVTGPEGLMTFVYDDSGRLVQEQRQDIVLPTPIPAVSPAIVQYGYDGGDNRSVVATYATPVPSIEAFNGSTLPSTVAVTSGTWTVASGVLTGNAGAAKLTLTASPNLRCPTVSVQVKPQAPASGGAVNAAGLQVTSSAGPQYRVLWRMGPPVAGDFNGLPQGSLAVVEVVTVGSTTTTTDLAVSAPVGDDGTAFRTLTLIVWPDNRITAEAAGTNLVGTLRVDVPAAGVNSVDATLPTLALVATGSATFDQLSWSVAASRTVRSSTYDLFNRLTADSELTTVGGVATANTSYGYDSYDRMASRTRTQGAATTATTYGYDDLDRMTSVAVNAATQATMTYYGDSWMRATETAGGVTTKWTYDGAQLLTQTTGGQTVTFVHQGGQALWEHDAVVTAPGLRVYAHDPFGNVRGHIATLTSSGVTKNAYQRQFAYDAYGSVLREQIASFSAGAFGLTPIGGAPTSGLRAKGMFLDGGLNLYKTQTRSYAADLGRFTQQDPAKAGPNWYAYCGGDPVNRMDPSGLDFINVGININGEKDDDAVLWLSDDADGTSIGNLTKGGKSNIGRLDPADRSMVMLMGGAGRVPLASLQRLAQGSHFLGNNGFGENVDQSIDALQIALAAAQNFQPGDGDLTGDEDPVDQFLAQRGRDFAWGVDAAHALRKDLAIALLTLPGGPIDAAFGKVLGAGGEAISAWRAARAARRGSRGLSDGSQIAGVVERYTAKYEGRTAGEAQKIGDLLVSLEKRGLTVEEGAGAAYANGRILFGSSTRRWEVVEEFMHHKVAQGWGKAELENLANALLARRIPGPGGAGVRSPFQSMAQAAAAAEEILVKQFLLRGAKQFGFGEAEIEFLKAQIQKLSTTGLKGGY